jgi:hypothetical protein
MHMRIHFWYLTLGIVGASAVALAGCTVNTTNNNGTGDGGNTDDGTTGTSEPDSATDTGTATPTPEGSTTVVTDAGDGGLVCDIPSGADACDTCALTSCCAAENTCQSETANDAGTTDCEDIFSCVQDCLAPPPDAGVDGGTLSDCTTTCSAGHTTQGMTDFTGLSTCLASSCASQCQ